MNKRQGNPMSLRVPQLTRLLRLRCGIQLPADDAGREYAALMLEHHSKLPDASRRMDNFLDLWTPWMAPDERESLKRLAATSDTRWTADRLGEELRLTHEERQQCRITTIGAAGDTSAAREERRRQRRAEAERQRRRAKNGDRRRQERARRIALPSPQAMVVFEALPAEAMCTVTDLVVSLERHPLFRDAAGATLRRRVLRAIKDLEEKQLAETKTELGLRGLPTMSVRRL